MAKSSRIIWEKRLKFSKKKSVYLKKPSKQRLNTMPSVSRSFGGGEIRAQAEGRSLAKSAEKKRGQQVRGGAGGGDSSGAFGLVWCGARILLGFFGFSWRFLFGF